MPIPTGTTRIQRQLMRERVYTVLRDWIIHGTLRPGEKVRDLELAERLGVSRTPVREALQRLGDEGLIESAANRWTRVAPANVEDAHRLYPIIWVLEGLAIRLASVHLDPHCLREMNVANRRLAEALQRGRAVEASAADREFHSIFIRQSRNPELIKILQNLKSKLRRLEAAYFGESIVADQSVSEHRRILRALRARDAHEAMEAVEANWRNSLSRLNQTLMRRQRTPGTPELAAPGA